MSTADKLNKLLETKQAIKQAIIDKGVDVSDNTVFAEYPAKINAIEGANDIDLSNYVTKDELPPIRVIGSDNPDEPYVLTGNEFTDEEYENDWVGAVYFNNVKVLYRNEATPEGDVWDRIFSNGLYSVCLSYWDKNNDGVMYKDIYIENTYDGMYDFDIHPETGVIEENWSDFFVYYGNLEDYATKEELNNVLGDIESLLGNI